MNYVGAKILLLNSGSTYTTYRDFFMENGLEDYAPFFKYRSGPQINKPYLVVAQGKHINGSPIAILQDKDTKQIYLLDVSETWRKWFKVEEITPDSMYKDLLEQDIQS